MENAVKHLSPAAPLKGRVALVTGGASGIGRACVERFAAAGAKVIAVDKAAEGELVANAIRQAGGDVQFECRDVELPSDVTTLGETVLRWHGGVDIVMNVVGGAHLKPVVDMDLAWWNAEIHFNLTTAFLVSREFLPGMIERRRGVILNTSSGWGFRAAPLRAGYAAAKAGLLAFSRSLAAETAEYGVRVNIVAPGPVVTERMLTLTVNDDLSQSAQQSIPLRRLGLPEDAAAAALFLASDDASYITGQVIHVNGGLIMP